MPKHNIHSFTNTGFFQTIRPRINILHIEDNVADMMLLRHHFLNEDEKYRVMSARRLADAFGFVDEAQIDVIVLDLNLLDMDGVASVAAIKAKLPEVPIIVYSGNRDEIIIGSSFLCSAKKFLTKGIATLQNVEGAIREVVNPSHAAAL